MNRQTPLVNCSAHQPRVVIIGGGFGGLCAAREVAGAPVSVTLIAYVYILLETGSAREKTVDGY